MRVNGLKCDTCDVLYNNFNPCEISYVPEGWFSAVRGKKFSLLQSDQELLHFCSIKCLSQWTEKQATPKPVEVAEATEDDTPTQYWRDL